MRFISRAVLLAVSVAALQAQIYSPQVLKSGQPDTTNLPALARTVFAQAHAQTARQKAEAIWRFFLTDGRFAKPGMIYHIAGWAYEEPSGEVLDPIRLLNSYGFGLCYHIAPLLESVFKAGGFEDSRVWFLTGHTVAEVFYDGAYHYFDSDMMGYNPVGTLGPVKERPVASVHQIEVNPAIITGKLVGPKQMDVANVDSPWYPADVREHAISGLADLFATAKDNYVYPFQRYQLGHTMDFVLRPGEQIVRYFEPEPAGLSYLPYRFDGTSWREFPQEIAEYKIRTADGPQSQKDARRWATGMQQYRPPASATAQSIFAMPCPYIIIDADFQMDVRSKAPEGRVTVETSVDSGQTWIVAGTLTGSHSGPWTATPKILTKSEHGARNAVSGTYGYLVRLTHSGMQIQNLTLTTRFQLNPRTLPELEAGENQIHYQSSDRIRWELPGLTPVQMLRAAPITSEGQTYLANSGAAEGEIVFALEAPDGGEINGFDAGGRFLDLHNGLAPDKFTAEVRKVTPWPKTGQRQTASLSWSPSLDGPYQTIWNYDPQPQWKDHDPIDRMLRWPEVDRSIRELPRGTHRIYVRYRLHGVGLDALRLAALRTGLRSADTLQITHVWLENSTEHRKLEQIPAAQSDANYLISIPPGKSVVNRALILANPRKGE